MARSAKGLFKATGNAAKPVVQLMLDGSLARVDADQVPREVNDFNPTPPEPTRAFLHAELRRILALGGDVWENAAGDGAMVRELEAVGLSVFASDLIDRGCGAEIRSFYDFQHFPHIGGKPPAKRVIVSNPPFSECNVDPGWVRFGLEDMEADYMALLLPLGWCGAGQARGKLWTDHPPARVYVMRWRIDFTGGGAPPMLNAWYVWDGRTREEDVRLLMLDKKDARQGELL